MRALLLRSLCFLFLLLATSSAWSLDPDRHISQYGHTAWRIQDGFFDGPVRAITQTTDGYIWIGTEAGLFRFDGVRLVSWSSHEGEQLPSTFITALLGAHDGSLWIGTDAGLVHQVDGHLLTYRNGRGVISSILQDVAGEIWITRTRIGDATQSFCKVIDTDVRCYGREDGVPAFQAAGPLAQDAAGNLWIGGDTTLLRWRPGSFDAYKPKALKSNAGMDGVEAVTVAADGSLWVGMALTGRGAGLQHLVDRKLKSFVAPKLNGETLQVMALLEDHQKNLWVGTANQGIYRIHGTDVDHYRSIDGLSSDFIFAFYEDREGNLWVATAKGLDSFRDLRVSSFSTREGLRADGVDSVLASPDGAIWVGNTSNLTVLNPGGLPSQAGKTLHGHQVTSLLEDHAGRLWAGIDNTLSIYEGRQFSQVRRRDGSPVGVVVGMAEDSENNIWAETLGPPGTLIRIRDLKVREEFPSPQMPLARKIAGDPQSGIWFGLVNGDLARYRSGKTEIFRFPHHPDSRVNELIAASDGSILGATAFGVVGWKNGKHQILTVRNGLPCNNIHALISDKQGDLWLYAQCGLIQIANAEVQRWWQQPESTLELRVFDASGRRATGTGSLQCECKKSRWTIVVRQRQRAANDRSSEHYQELCSAAGRY
jgi:ligand-binding sensor domain-containing protein